MTAVDIIPEKVELINNKKSPIQDDYIEKYLGCEGDNCSEAVEVIPGEKIILKTEANNKYDKYAVQIYNLREQLLGYCICHFSNR